MQGEGVDLDPVAVVQTATQGDLSFLKQFTIVVASQLTQALSKQLCSACAQLQLPLLLLQSVGLVVSLRLFAPEHRVVESKPADKEILDLHLLTPFPELKSYAETFKLTELDDMNHGHVPYIVLLMQQLDKWKAEHGGNRPTSFADKTEFRAALKAGSRSFFKEMNFQEAVNNAHLCFSEEVPEGTLAVLDDPQAQGNSPASPLFWVLAEAVASFRRENNELPLSGSIPDMTATTDYYITLQNLFQAKAKQDLEWVRSKTASILQRQLSDDESEFAATFCKNIKALELIRYRTVEEELAAPLTEDLSFDLDESPSLVQWYVALRAREVFRERENRYPGAKDFKADAQALETDGKSIAAALGLPEEVYSASTALEMARYGTSELHTMSALLGGVASQEAVKLITKQFSPINNTFVFSGIHSKGTVYRV